MLKGGPLVLGVEGLACHLISPVLGQPHWVILLQSLCRQSSHVIVWYGMGWHGMVWFG